MAPKIRRALALSLLPFGACLPVPAGAQWSLAADRHRLSQITGDSATATGVSGRYQRGGRLDLGSPRSGLQMYAVVPEVRYTYNSAIPYSMNDGPLWAGRGSSLGVEGGFGIRQRYGSATFDISLVPALTYSQNRPFQVFASTVPGRSEFSNPFHPPPASLDLPHRFGSQALLTADLGASTFLVSWPAVAVGATSANEWWGPGIRNALVMSDNAAGVPRFFVRTARPARTPIGAVEAQLLSGTLTQSRFFDASASENRTLSGLLVQLRPRFDSAVTIGFSRVVYAPIGSFASPFTLTLSRTFDAIARWENLDGAGQRSDQIGALFARWVFPRAGFEIFGEWARMDLPRTPLELLTAAHHSGAWTFGFQWAREARPERFLRLQSEFTYLEQSRVFPERPSPDFYSGQASPQGYTQRGQVMGAAIGPGSSSQWLALDWIAPRWQAGGYLNRVRWDNDALYRMPSATFWDHDVSFMAGLRAGWRTDRSDFSLDLGAAKRFNYLFQNGTVRPGGYRTVDVNNVTLALVATPR